MLAGPHLCLPQAGPRLWLDVRMGGVGGLALPGINGMGSQRSFSAPPVSVLHICVEL